MSKFAVPYKILFLVCLLLPAIAAKANAADSIDLVRDEPDPFHRQDKSPLFTKWECDPGPSRSCTITVPSSAAVTSQINAAKQQVETQLIEGLAKLDKEVFASTAVEQTKAALEQKITDLDARISSLERRITELASKLPSDGK
jgi:cell division protein FtsB